MVITCAKTKTSSALTEYRRRDGFFAAFPIKVLCFHVNRHIYMTTNEANGKSTKKNQIDYTQENKE